MGTWGTGLYDDDTACDVRDAYQDMLGDGVAEPEATVRLTKEWSGDLSDPDTGPVFWLALADVQWRLGRLQEAVKSEALAVIEGGSDLARWSEDKKLEAKRRAVLERLKVRLNTPQPAEKRVRKRYVDATDWKLGDVYSFRLQSGKLALLHVIGFHEDRGGRGPVCALLDWTGETAPDKKTMKKMKYRAGKGVRRRQSQFLIGSLSARDMPRDRITLVAQGVKPKQACGGYAVIPWRFIDRQLDALYGLQ